ncbi:MAG TPA: glycosyltransferase, partial [Candidatus Paceibacterota bacterium]|nr:glycosyltransferase [Candidatus Paceibacterota bacterium]
MKVLMISGDPKLLEPHTEAHERFLLQCAAVDELRLVVWSPRAPFAVLGALGAVLTTRFDVVTAQDPLWRGLLALVLARLGGAKLQIQVHQNVDALLGINRAIFKAVVKRADAIRAVSETIKAQVERAGARVYVDVLPVFIDLEVLKRAPAADLKKEFPQFGKTVFWIG